MEPIFRKIRVQIDWTLLLVIMAIVAVGLINLYSASRTAVPGMFTHQIYGLILGFSAFLVITTIDYRLYNQYGYLIYGLGIATLVLVLFVGRTVKGSTRWIGFGPLQIQPSELMKVVMAIALAKYLHNDPTPEGRTLKQMAAPFALVALPVALILKQPDLGTGMLVLLMFFSVMLFTKLKLRSLLTLISTGAVILPLTWSLLLKGYQKRRILAFLDPSADPTGAGWHLRQSIYAIGSGRILGKGFLQGTQHQFQFLPEHWTDFPFSVWAEEWGFIGGIILLGLYLFLVLWSIRLAANAKDRFGALLCLGIGSMFFWHVVINIGMVTGLLPVVGVTLPLFSYGRSSVLTFMLGAGLLMSVASRRYWD
ncbi:MAG: rod shape-determining protein RodA [Deltaproteobacteria bacterium]|nr:rod shape-determining protein RodA [Deltaproteobacteria bacterium]